MDRAALAAYLLDLSYDTDRAAVLEACVAAVAGGTDEPTFSISTPDGVAALPSSVEQTAALWALAADLNVDMVPAGVRLYVGSAALFGRILA